MRLRLTASLCAGPIIAVSIGAGGQPPALRDRIIDRHHTVSLPVHHCTVPSAVAYIARHFEVLAGIEYLPGDCSPAWADQPRPTDTVSLLGMSVAEALDTLVKLDPRYRWTETDGVVVVRPVEAWANPANLLNQVTSSLVVDDTNLGGALTLIGSALRGQPRVSGDQLATRTEQGARRFSVHLGSTSVAGALTAIVRAHGNLRWEARTRSGSADPHDLMLYLYTQDGSGLGILTRSLTSTP
jgi:hypothetical protein